MIQVRRGTEQHRRISIQYAGKATIPTAVTGPTSQPVIAWSRWAHRLTLWVKYHGDQCVDNLEGVGVVARKHKCIVCVGRVFHKQLGISRHTVRSHEVLGATYAVDKDFGITSGSMAVLEKDTEHTRVCHTKVGRRGQGARVASATRLRFGNHKDGSQIHMQRRVGVASDTVTRWQGQCTATDHTHSKPIQVDGATHG